MVRLNLEVRDRLMNKNDYKKEHHEFIGNLIDELDWLSYLIQMTKEMYEKQPAFDIDLYKLICEEEDRTMKILKQLDDELEELEDD